MDEFEKRLKKDAEGIRAEVSPGLRQRIDTSLRGTRRIEAVPQSRNTGINLWWTSSLTGLAAAIIVIVLINWNRPAADSPPPVVPVAEHTVPVVIDDLRGLNPPRLLRTAEFTSPLEDELARLKADIEKARAAVREDIDFTF